MRCEYTLDEGIQRGYVLGAAVAVLHGNASQEQAGQLLQQKAEQLNHVPAYVRQAHKMLTKALQQHDKQAGIVDAQ